jgi:LysR family transcriptional regulator, low CO2-responsive transcriptional regulator
VRKLEEEYDILLFDRQRRQVRLTPAGERFSRSRENCSTPSSRHWSFCRNHARCAPAICASWQTPPTICSAILAAFREKHPGVRVTVRAGNTESVVANLHSYEADVGVLGEVPRGANSRWCG